MLSIKNLQILHGTQKIDIFMKRFVKVDKDLAQRHLYSVESHIHYQLYSLEEYS